MLIHLAGVTGGVLHDANVLREWHAVQNCYKSLMQWDGVRTSLNQCWTSWLQKKKQYGTVPWLVSPSEREANKYRSGIVQIYLYNSGTGVPSDDALSTPLELGIRKNVISAHDLYQSKF